MHFGRNKVPFFYAGDFIAVGDHFAAEFMSGNEWWMNSPLRPAVPFVDVQVSAANRRDFNLHQHVSPAKAWNFDFTNVRSWRGFRLNHRQHGIGHQNLLVQNLCNKILILAPREEGADSVARFVPILLLGSINNRKLEMLLSPSAPARRFNPNALALMQPHIELPR